MDIVISTPQAHNPHYQADLVKHIRLSIKRRRKILVCTIGSNCAYRYDSQAYLFSLVNKPGWGPVKLNQTGSYSYYRSNSVYHCSSYGPTFGAGHDIYISSYASYSSSSYSNLDYTYSPPSGYYYGSNFVQTFLAGSYSFTPDEIEVFYDETFASQGWFFFFLWLSVFISGNTFPSSLQIR